MSGYYFSPMMPAYCHIFAMTTKKLMSADGRNYIARTIQQCRKHHGKDKAKELHYALIRAGAIYPQLPQYRRINMVRIQCDNMEYSLTGYVTASTDLDGQFTMICEDTGQRLLVNGWLFYIEILADKAATV